MELLDKAKMKLGNDSRVAEYLGVHRSMLSQIRMGNRPMSPLIAGKLAELLELNPAEVVFRTLEEQAGKKDEARKWHEWRKYLAATLAVAFVAAGLSGHSPESHASEFPSYSAGSNPGAEYSMRP